MSNAVAFWSILKKDMRTYYLKPPNISWGIIFPFAWMLMMVMRTKTAFDAHQMFPGLTAMSILFGTTSMLSVTITFERKARSFERLLLSPLPMELLVCAKAAGAILFGVFNGLIPVAVSVLYFKAPVASWPILAYGIVFTSIVSTLLALLISVSANEVFEAQTYSNFFRFPMIFLCGLFVPVTELPVAARALSYLLPVTYGVDIIRGAADGRTLLPPAVSMAAIAAFCAALFVLSIRNIKRRWIA